MTEFTTAVVIILTTLLLLVIAAATKVSRERNGGVVPNIIPHASLTCRSWKYDVFLSFRGTDVRKTFVDHLYTALKNHAIDTYKDDVTLERGDTIEPALWTAIHETPIALIIFSENYADSSWCLNELSHIMNCKVSQTWKIVIPIFYDVVPSDVRKQRGRFGKAFAKLHKLSKYKKEVKSWKKALVDASDIAGWDPEHDANGHEAKFIEMIVGSILDKLSSILDSVVDDKHLVGMETRLQQLRSHLKIGSGGKRMVGIWGVGGGGKTTLVTSLYMKLKVSGDFDGCCFVENIREESKQQHGLKSLQEKIISTVFKKEMKVESVEIGKQKIKQMLRNKKVLIVLDDVDNLEQLEALAGSHKWFGDGSRIIVATRNEQVLNSRRVDEVYQVSLLLPDEAIRLFRKHAYRKDNPVQDYEELSLCVISYVNGLPLALKILGNFLYDKDKNEWMSALEKLKYIPNSEVTHQLKISYDGLDDEEKELFLDIACFHRGAKEDDAMKILDACGFHSRIGVKVLKQKALITVSKDGRFDMHDLVQDMAHYIVRGEHPNNPEKYSRVWRREDIEDICSMNASTKNNKIKAITCHSIVNLSNCVMPFSNMKTLRLLKVTTTSFNKGPSFLSNELRYMDWERYPASPFPKSFQPKKLVILKMKESLQEELWKGTNKYLPCLKELELVGARNLVRTPDFGGLPCLEKLILFGCDSLKEIHESLGNHSSLIHVSVIDCGKLARFPHIVRMDKLEVLRISRCKSLDEFPMIEAKMDNLVELYLDEVGIQVLPPSVGEYCTNLISLKLEWCSNLKSIQGNFHALKFLENFHVNVINLGSNIGISILPHLPRSSLTKLDLSCCRFKDGEIPSEIGELSNLRELHLRCNGFTRLDFSLSRLTYLKLLDLRRCENLVELPNLPSTLAILKADGCESLEVIQEETHRICNWLCEVSIRGDRKNITGGEILLKSMLQGKAVKSGSGCMILQLKGLEIPRGFEPRVVRGSICRMPLPENWYIGYSGFLFCVVLDNRDDAYSDFPKITTRLKHKKLTHKSMRMRDSQGYEYWEETDNDKHKYTCMIYTSFGSLRNTLWWDQTSNVVQLEFDSLDKYTVSGCGSKLICNTSETTITDSSLDDLSDDYTCQLKILQDSKSAFKFYIDQDKNCASN